MIMVTGQARFEPGEIERLRGDLNRWTAQVRRRDGCESYCYAVDLEDPDLLHLVEMWRDEAAIEAHMADLGPLMEVLEGARMLALDVRAYEARYVRTLMGE